MSELDERHLRAWQDRERSRAMDSVAERAKLGLAECFKCGGFDDVRICSVQFVPESVGVLRPVCATCRREDSCKS